MIIELLLGISLVAFIGFIVGYFYAKNEFLNVLADLMTDFKIHARQKTNLERELERRRKQQ